MAASAINNDVSYNRNVTTAVAKPATENCLEKTVNKVTSTKVISVAHSLCGDARAATCIAKKITPIHSRVLRGIAATQFTTILTVPLMFYSFVNNIKALITGNTREARVDASLGAVADVSDMVDGVSTFGFGLAESAATTNAALAWANPMMLIAAIISVINYVIIGRSLHFNKKLMKEFDKATESNKTAVINFANKHSYKLQTHSGIDPKLFTKTVAKLEKKEDLDKAYEILKTRVKHKNHSLALGILITTVFAIASTVLFFPIGTPLVIFAAVCLGIGYSTNIGKMFFDLYSARRCNKQLKALAA